MKKNWPYYVYQFIEDGNIVYVGKGSKGRLSQQRRRFKLEGYEVARFKYEVDCLKYEKQLIALYKPKLNKTSGGESGARKGFFKPSDFKVATYGDHYEMAAELLIRYGFYSLGLENYQIIKNWLIERTSIEQVSKLTRNRSII